MNSLCMHTLPTQLWACNSVLVCMESGGGPAGESPRKTPPESHATTTLALRSSLPLPPATPSTISAVLLIPKLALAAVGILSFLARGTKEEEESYTSMSISVRHKWLSSSSSSGLLFLPLLYFCLDSFLHTEKQQKNGKST